MNRKAHFHNKSFGKSTKKTYIIKNPTARPIFVCLGGLLEEGRKAFGRLGRLAEPLGESPRMP